ncbi:MAG TPA: EVE domain-containing protein [Polyangiaceae bacterium]|nr:EVE domain-containing protein [Polyangiaceae bacterium]
MPRQYWLVKSEPDTYPWERLQKEGRAVWDGVRNFMARNNLRAMKEGDIALFYHSNVGKEIVGAAKVVREAYPDPTAKGEDWSVVDLAPAFAFKKPVTLEVMRKQSSLEGFKLITHPRLSVVPVSPEHFATILALGETKAPK